MAGGYGGIRLGRRLRELREATQPKLTQLEVVARTHLSQPQLSRIERGRSMPKEEDVVALLALYAQHDVDPEDAPEMRAAARSVEADRKDRRLVVQRGTTAAMQHMWWTIEREAELVRDYHPALIVGELQTVDYASIVLKESPDSPPVRDRQERRKGLLTQMRPRFRVIQTEGSLRYRVGSAALMAEQIEAIIEASHRPNVEFGLIPWWQSVGDVTPVCGFGIHDVKNERTVVVGVEVAATTFTSADDVAEFEALFERIAAVAVWGEDARVELRRILAETT